MKLEEMIRRQREWFATDATKDLGMRLEALRRLQRAIQEDEEKIRAALHADLHKSGFESYMTEIGMVLDELRFVIRHTKEWARDRRVRTPLAQFHAKSFVVQEPYGVTLIMAPWNYPFQLSLEPLVGAIAAGNTVVLKPSAYAPATSQVIADLIAKCFPPEHAAVVQGGRKENNNLLEQRFDYIFFTGGVAVGKLVMESAARNLTPVSLELGGKSPCIIDETADWKLASKRLAFGKYLNAGQTCVAPDYLFVHRSVMDRVVEELKSNIRAFFGEDPLQNPDLPRIVNEKHFQRLKGLMEGEQVLAGGRAENGFLEPTILGEITPQSRIMQEEIFGPILPVLVYDRLDEAISYINAHEKPLALYLFTQDARTERRVLRSVSFGGGCINDTIIHLATPHMGFGGVGLSGMGSYHGKKSFETFSHSKSIVKKYQWIDLPIRYHPYTAGKEKLLRWFLK